MKVLLIRLGWRPFFKHEKFLLMSDECLNMKLYFASPNLQNISTLTHSIYCTVTNFFLRLLQLLHAAIVDFTVCKLLYMNSTDFVAVQFEPQR